MSNFTDKIVVITGGSDGIVKALVAQFLALGAKVALVVEMKINSLY